MPHLLTCLSCASVNRVPQDRPIHLAKCGICGDKLLDGKVAAIDPKTLTKAAKTDSMPLVVDFWAPWCGPCRSMAPEFAKAAQAMVGTARFAKIDTQDHAKVNAVYGIRGIPLLILFQNGKERGRLAGARPSLAISDFVMGAASAK